MKFQDLTIIFLCINVAIAVINAAGIFPGFSILPQQQWINTLIGHSSQNEQYFQSAATQQVSSSFGFGDFIRGLIIFVETFAVGLAAPGYLMHAFGLNITLSLLLSLPIYPIYFTGIAQMISNRTTKYMD